MNSSLKAIIYLIIHLLIQSMVIGIVASIVWNLTLSKSFNIHLNYFQWFGITFIVGLLRFDIVDRINSFNNLLNNNQENEIP